MKSLLMISLLALLPFFAFAQTPATSCISCSYAKAAGLPQNVVCNNWNDAATRVVQIVGDKTLRQFFADHAGEIFKKKGLQYGGSQTFVARDDTNDLKVIFEHCRKVPADTAKYHVFIRPKTVGEECVFLTLTKSGTGFVHGDLVTRKIYLGEWEFGIADEVLGYTRCGNEDPSEGRVIQPKDVEQISSTGPDTNPKEVTTGPGLGIARSANNVVPTTSVADGETHIHIHMDGNDGNKSKPETDSVSTEKNNLHIQRDEYAESDSHEVRSSGKHPKWCLDCKRRWRRCICYQGVVLNQRSGIFCHVCNRNPCTCRVGSLISSTLCGICGYRPCICNRGVIVDTGWNSSGYHGTGLLQGGCVTKIPNNWDYQGGASYLAFVAGGKTGWPAPLGPPNFY